MKNLLLLFSLGTLIAHAADLPPDKSSDLPESAKRPVVVTGKSNLALPKHDLPADYTLTVAATAPLVTHPIMGCLDDRGRLFVGDAVGVNWNKAQLEANPPNRVLMLEDTDRDGAFDKSTVFADKMTFPQGACWLDGSLYVGSPPSIWKLTDTDDDGVADKREEIVTGFDYTGNAADIHGPFLHPNGRLYWCHGRKGHDVKQKDGTPVDNSKACGIWSCNPDGSDVSWHSLGCGDNPVEVDFTPEGDIIGVQNLYYNQPRGDTIIHWLYGGVYERADQLQAIAHLPRTLETMPVMYNFGHVAVSGCCFWRNFPTLNPKPETQHFMVTHFNTQRLVRMELTPEGSTYKAVENEFLKLHNPDIHLTDVMEDADGSLLVIDTGGWFRIGCPSSLMAKSDIHGAVYRIKKTGIAPVDPYGLAIEWQKPTFGGNHVKHDVTQLVGLLRDSRPFVRQKASHLLVRDGRAIPREADCHWDLWLMTLHQEVEAGIRTEDSHIRRAGLLASFAGGQIENPQSMSSIYFCDGSDNKQLPHRPDFAKAMAWRAFPTQAPCSALELVSHRWEWSPVIWSNSISNTGSGSSIQRPCRIAPSVLGYGELLDICLRRTLSSESRALLLQTLADETLDPAAEHQAIAAAIVTKTFGLADLKNSRLDTTKRRLLRAVSQTTVDPKSLAETLETTLPWLSRHDTKLRDAVVQFASSHPEAAIGLEPLLDDWLANAEFRIPPLQEASQIIRSQIKSEAAQRMVFKLLNSESAHQREFGIRILETQSAGAINDTWLKPLEALLKKPTTHLLDAIKNLNTTHFDKALLSIGSDVKLPLSLRLKALDSVKSIKLEGTTFAMVKSVLTDTTSSAASKIQAAGMLAQAPIPKEQMAEIAPLFASIGPVELKTLLPLLKKHKDPEIARTVAREIAKNPAIASQQESSYRTALADLPVDIFESIILPAYQTATASLEAKKRQLGPLAEKAIISGNAVKGAEHFKAGKGTCIACHKVGDTGRAIGPDLSKIGAIRTERDLLESILFPSNTLARDYEAHIIETSDGQQTLGLIKSHTAEGLLVIDIAGQEKNIPHPQIIGDTPLPTSLMPMGLDQTLPESELLDLVAWLRSLK